MNQGALWIALLSVVLSGFMAALQMSLRTVSRMRLKAMAERSGRRKPVDRVIDDVPGHVLAVSLLRVLFSLIAVLGVLAWVADAGVGADAAISWARLVTAVAVAGTLLYLGAVVVPMSVADHVGDSLLHSCAPFLWVIGVLMTPVIRLMRFVDVVVKRLAGVRDLTDAEELEHELRSVVSEGEHEGSLNEEERDMIEAIVDFRTRTAEEVMTPRTEIEGIEHTHDLKKIRNFIEAAGHSRIPVYEGDLDHIIGILYAKDLLAYLGADAAGFDLLGVLRKARFVPETKPVSELLAEFKRDKVHMAIVLDEYGGTAGLVTIEDILEEIVGEIQDEYEPADDTPPEISVSAQDRSAEIDARATINDVNDELEDLGVEIPEGEDYDTVGGFVLASLGHIPVAGEEFRSNGLLVRVLAAEPTRVVRVRVEFDAPGEHREPAPAEARADEPPK